MITIRVAGEQDYKSIASIHAASWRSAYRGILPDDYLGEGLDAERENYWKKKMASLRPSDFVLVASREDGDVGFIAVLDKPEAGFQAFIDNLHARPEMKGIGIGGKLMSEAAHKLISSGRTSAYLWVLDGNTPAEGFYLSKGASIADTSTVVFGGVPILQRRFVWNNVKRLIS